MNQINIIIPCYYNECVIARCLNSLSKQTDKNFNIIMVNDNSPYEQNDYINVRQQFSKFFNIKYIKLKSNMGPGMARQIGLNSLADDDQYVMFLDDDDTLDINFIKKCNNIIKEVSNEDILALITIERKYINIENSMSFWDKVNSFTGMIFNYQLIKKFNIKFVNSYFDEDLNFFQKYNFKLKQLVNNSQQKIIITHLNAIYNKFNNLNSLTTQNPVFKTQYALISWLDLLIFILNENSNDNNYIDMIIQKIYFLISEIKKGENNDPHR